MILRTHEAKDRSASTAYWCECFSTVRLLPSIGYNWHRTKTTGLGIAKRNITGISQLLQLLEVFTSLQKLLLIWLFRRRTPQALTAIAQTLLKDVGQYRYWRLCVFPLWGACVALIHFAGCLLWVSAYVLCWCSAEAVCVPDLLYDAEFPVRPAPIGQTSDEQCWHALGNISAICGTVWPRCDKRILCLLYWLSLTLVRTPRVSPLIARPVNTNSVFNSCSSILVITNNQ